MNTSKIRKPKLNVTIQNPAQFKPLPSKHTLKKWVCCGLAETLKDVEITIRFVTEEESHDLNARYRNQSKPTNILSFNYDNDVMPHALLGDLVLCGPVILREAHDEHKSVEFHLAHLIIHGVLHLQGYDHQTDHDACAMETKEIALLADLQFPNPYNYHQEKS